MNEPRKNASVAEGSGKLALGEAEKAAQGMHGSPAAQDTQDMSNAPGAQDAPAAAVSQDAQDARTAERFVALANDNPAARSAYRALLQVAALPIERVALAGALEGAALPATFVQSPQNAISTLVRAGVLSETVLVDGVPYAGTARDLQSDESVSADAEVSFLAQITPAGALALEALAPAREIAALFGAKPHHVRAFRMVLGICARQGGATPADVEALLEADPRALRRTDGGAPAVYPSYFTDALEKAGAISWSKAAHTWNTTPAGRDAL